MIRDVAVLTASRADYGLLFWLLRELKNDRSVRLRLLACGSHLSEKFGKTIRAIERDGFPIAAKVPTLPKQDTPLGLARAMGNGAADFAAAFQRLRPDILVVLGDRFELLAACSAAVAARIPIAHIHGGESTEGVIDEQIRHAVTKMSHLHFPAADSYRRRIISMGEPPSRVFNFGAPGLEYLRRLRPLPRPVLEKKLGRIIRRPFAVVTYHPTSAGRRQDAAAVSSIFRNLRRLNLRAVATFANADMGGRAINENLRRLAARNPDWIMALPSLGQEAYPSLLMLARAVVGNSSSGIIEAPSLKIPTVNIGDRQQGRLRSPSVIDCGASERSILRALKQALSPRFRKYRCKGCNAYGKGLTAARIAAALKSFSKEELLRKSFYDSKK